MNDYEKRNFSLIFAANVKTTLYFHSFSRLFSVNDAESRSSAVLATFGFSQLEKITQNYSHVHFN